MAGTSWDLEAFAGTGLAARWILAGVGMVMTFIMQSSSAAAATTLVALNAGSQPFVEHHTAEPGDRIRCAPFVHAARVALATFLGASRTTAISASWATGGRWGRARE